MISKPSWWFFPKAQIYQPLFPIKDATYVQYTINIWINKRDQDASTYRQEILLCPCIFFFSTIYSAPCTVHWIQSVLNKYLLHALIKKNNAQFYGKDGSFLLLHQFTSHVTSLNVFLLIIKYLLTVENINTKKSLLRWTLLSIYNSWLYLFIHLTNIFDFLFCARLCGYGDESNRPGSLMSLQLYAIPSRSTCRRIYVEVCHHIEGFKTHGTLIVNIPPKS